MGKYIIRRLLWAVVVLFFVSLITFVIGYAVPGDAAKSMAGPHATPDVLQRVREEKGLDKPLFVQYERYMRDLLHGNARHPALLIQFEMLLRSRLGLDDEELEILIHEMLHACFWDLDEEVVSEVGRDLSKALWKMGYRKQK